MIQFQSSKNQSETCMNSQEIVVGIADYKVAKAPVVLSTNLGSCIAVCLYSSLHKAGSMLHIILPDSSSGINKDGIKTAKFADTGIPEMFNKLQQVCGVGINDCVAKLFGGAKILQQVSNNIGQANEIAARAVLKQLGIRVVAAKTGGEKGYRVKFDLITGKVQCQIFGEEIMEY